MEALGVPNTSVLVFIMRFVPSKTDYRTAVGFGTCLVARRLQVAR
jgi:hypothetical protein